MSGRFKLPSPALVISCLALIVALSGTAVAAGIVANARHANNADLAKRALNADKLAGKTAVQIAAAGAQAGAQLPGPASSAAGLVTLKTLASGQIAAQHDQTLAISCDGGAKIMGAGFSSDGPVFNFNSYPTSDTTWSFDLANGGLGGNGSQSSRIRNLPQVAQTGRACTVAPGARVARPALATSLGVSTRLTRSRFLRAALGTAGAVALAPSKGLAAAFSAPRLIGISVRNAGHRYDGDRALFATVSPGVAGRDTALVSFELKHDATVQLDVLRTALRQRTVVWTTREKFLGQQSVAGPPPRTPPPGRTSSG